MVMGGTPYYLEMLNNTMSLAQNIDNLLLRNNGPLNRELENLYAALFKNAEDYISVVKALSKRRDGMSRKEIVKNCGMSSGGGLTSILANLETCGFIRKYQSFSKQKTYDSIYQLVDFFTLFHFKFLEEQRMQKQWLTMQNTPAFYSWVGLSFELLAIKHAEQIKKKLGINGIQTAEYAWRGEDENGKAQIDLVIDRSDHCANICEMKFSIEEFEISNDYEKILRHKIDSFMKTTENKKSAIMTMVTTYGVKKGKFAGIIRANVTLDNLFS